MAVLPASKIDLIQFCESHWPVWQSNATAIGLTAAQVVAFKNQTEAARSKFTNAEAARLESKAATVSLNDTVSDLRGDAADLIRFVKAFADASPSPAAVYALAQIPPPSPRVPATPPGKPKDFAVALNTDGSITIRWKSENSAPSGGAFFSVFRRIGPAGSPFALVGNTGGRVFTDDTLVLGTTQATYIVQGFRGQEDGEASDQLTVQFGVGAGPGESFTVYSTPNSRSPIDMAA